MNLAALWVRSFYLNYTQHMFIPQHTKYVEGYIVFAFPLVRTFDCSFVRLCVMFVDTRVKVFALKFIRPYIIKTLWWISSIFGMNGRYAGLKFYLVPSPCWSLTLSSRPQNFHKKRKTVNLLHLSLYSYIIKTLWWISFIFGMMVDIGLKFYSWW